MLNRSRSIAQDYDQIFDTKMGETPTQVSDLIVPIVPIEPSSQIVRGASANNAASTTIYTTPADKDFYLTFASIVGKQVATAAQSTKMALTVVIGNVRQDLIMLVNIANQNTTNPASTFIGKILLDRGSTITLTQNSPTAGDQVGGTIAGYTRESTKGQ